MRIAIIGCGTMGTGLAELLSPLHQVFLYDRNWQWTQELAEKTKSQACQSLDEAIKSSQVIFLAFKPQNLKEIAPGMTSLQPDHIVISILAGTLLSTLQHYFPRSRLVRTMPNLAMRYGAGVVGIVECSFSPDFKTQIEELLAPLGLIYWLKESQMDALTSLTSSGPAFILTLIEAMIEAGVAMGFQSQDAEHLISQMIQGCMTMMQKTGEHPAELKWKIASPGGATIAGLRTLEKENLRSGLIETFLAAYQRAQEMGRSHDVKEKN